jgi:predicted nuclease of predicted toxin-antitoxin system
LVAALAAFLLELGYPATHLHEQGLDRLTDSEILEKARQEESILLTHDLDFGDLLAASGARLPSVVIFRLRNMSPERVNLHLRNVLTLIAGVFADGVIMTITEAGARIRRLPLPPAK